MRACVLWWCVAAASSLFVQVGRAQGEICKYTDERGVVHYTNASTDRRCKPVSYSQPSSGQPRLMITTNGAPGVHSINRRELRFGNISQRSSFDLHIQHAARVHQVDPLLVKAVIKAESDFNRYAVSSKGAQGLMQLMPTTARHLNVNDPFDPWQNIYGGARYLREMLDSFNGDLHLSLAAYNAGPSRVMRTGGIPRIPETINYVNKVLRHYQNYQGGALYAYAPAKNSIRVRQLVTVN
ncbi:transglycosylase SLT domain-containing protein [Candidatus Electronema sp. TJ]|uniref:transglycosylase SLT domain-containing protein n=1 Tax=Candidatus Electronema sp. TJ TaxID=3401573 RepID=UPI003AA949A0